MILQESGSAGLPNPEVVHTQFGAPSMHMHEQGSVVSSAIAGM
jgi:hypothetical protein